MPLKPFEWTYGCVKIHFGPSSEEALRGYVKDYKKVVIVTGRAGAKSSGALKDVESILNELGIQYLIYDRIVSNPPSSLAEDLARQVSSFGGEAVIAIGGGSTIDTAKVAAAIVSSGGTALDYLYGRRKAASCLPLFAVNLTHGTGSEVNRYANMTDVTRGDKLGNEVCYPKASFDDPRYTISMPKEQVICTTLDALYHAYESATTVGSSPLVLTFSLEAVRRIRDNLPLAVERLNDEVPRYWLMYAAMLAGVAIDLSPTNIIHQIENILSGISPSLAHGCGLAIIGPVLAPLIHQASPETSSQIIKTLDPSLSGVTPEAASKALADFARSVGFTKRLSDYGIGKDVLREAVRRAFSNPVVSERLRTRLGGVKIDEQRLFEMLMTTL
ncbi:MAG: Alcohol dehydrogenase, class IV [uncultured Acidilobus sp. CIS]|nr:MAG: Alcohol dehydrogenase, class IV [uncultured Acidilobus sp. CIS]